MNVFDALLVMKQDVNIVLFVDPGDGITRRTNDVGTIKFIVMIKFIVTPKLSVFCLILRLLNMLKECLLTFLTVTNWIFDIKLFL